MNQAPWLDRFGESLMKTLPTPKALLTRGEGCYVWDVDGNRYLDFLAGIAVNSLGHAHPAFVSAVSEQAAKLAHVSNYFTSEPNLELAERLKRITGAGEHGRVMFGNSGAEAIEAAFKLALLNRDEGAKKHVVALKGAFHGRTLGSLSLTGQPALHHHFKPLIPGVVHIDPTISALEAAVNHTVAAVILEPIQGEAGVVDLPAGFLKRARELTKEHGALLILDEIQTGVGRTGEWFSYQREGITPDAITVAKGIAGGFPLGALVTFPSASDLFQVGQHGSTYGGNPLATAVGNAVLREIEEGGLIENARVRGAQLKAGILAIGSPLVAEVRGAGLLIGVGLTEPVAGQLVQKAQDLGLIINAANPTSIRIAPPLIIGDSEVEEFLRLFAEVLAD